MTSADLMHGIPSLDYLIFEWLFKWYLAIIVSTGSSILAFMFLMRLFGEM